LKISTFLYLFCNQLLLWLKAGADPESTEPAPAPKIIMKERIAD